MKYYPQRFCIAILLAVALLSLSGKQTIDDRIAGCTFDPKTDNLQLYWKDDSGKILKSIQNLKTFVESKNQKLVFAMNGGMYMQDNSPLGLFIQDGKKITDLNTRTGNGNFYLMPNGVFYITKENAAGICKTENLPNESTLKYATQSGPMLLIDGDIHPAFKEGSTNLNVRNGVGILPDGTLLFAISKAEINFYDFASFFKKTGCKNALYLDGFVSRMYCENYFTQMDGNFGVMIGVTEEIAD